MARARILIAAVLLLIAALADGQTGSPVAPLPSTPTNSAQSAPALDVSAAVETYLAKMPPSRRARSNAYFEGGYWLILWDFLSIVLVMWLLLRFRWSARMRDLAERLTRFRILQEAIYWSQFTVLTAVLTSP
jgi:STE24 endopeptidase